MLAILLVMAAAVGYAKGHKDGSREGYIRGRAVNRHISQANKAVK
jgi:flagellar biosynthesis/type III secretory pathway protein FliH